ncbi:MAG TPA: thiol reductant ABC exporter subunit CydD [Aggregatilineales bacterium]|nr:thiol reductant ABC exporter subunit CydD [Aggregatilineales bacterium]
MNLDRRLFAEARIARFNLIVTITAGVLNAVLMVAQAWLLSCIVSGVFLGGDTLADAEPRLLLLLAASIGRAGTAWLQTASAAGAAARVKSSLRRRLFEHIAALGPSYTAGERSGELANTLVEGIDALDAYFAQYLPQLALAALVPLTVLLIAFPIDLLSGVVFLVTAPLIPIFMILIGKAAEALTARQWGVLSRMSAHFLDVLQGLTTLKLFDRARRQVEAIRMITEQFRRTTLSVLRVAFLSALVLEMVGTISTAIIAVQIGLRLLAARLPFVDALFVLLLAPEFYQALRNLGLRFHAGMSGVAAAQRIFAVLETAPSQTPSPRRTAHGGSTPLSPVWERGKVSALTPPFHIVFDDVHVAYEGEARPALNDVSFEIRPGETVALVGPSGAGKSTIAALLLRFVEPGQGTITVNGEPLAGIPAGAWREYLAWVPQRPTLFDDSAAANIRLARPDATLDEVIEAAKLAHAHEFISALPQGYDTPLGERGARLSGGQAQRIALARAFLRDAPLVLLDEATARLDPANEALIRAAMARLLEGRTALVIAHRLNTVTRADRIVVLEGGRIAQMGTHTDLLAASGLYRRLVGVYGGAA